MFGLSLKKLVKNQCIDKTDLWFPFKGMQMLVNYTTEFRYGLKTRMIESKKKYEF